MFFPTLTAEAGTREDRYERVIQLAPYCLLAVSTALSQTSSYPTVGERIEVSGLAAVAAAWMLVLYTLRPLGWRRRTGPMLVYFAGLVALSWALESRSSPEALSLREMEVLRMIADGAANREVAARLFVSKATIKTHLLHIYDKLGVHDRAAAVGEAYRRQLLA